MCLKKNPIEYDDAEKFTSEMHDPCTYSRGLQERTTQKHLQGAPVWSRPNTLRRLSQKCFYNSRVLERSQLRVPFVRMLGPFYSGEVLPPFLAEQVSSLQSKLHPCRASFLKRGGQVWAFVLSGAHTKDRLYLLQACGHRPVDMDLLGSPSLISYFILFTQFQLLFQFFVLL